MLFKDFYKVLSLENTAANKYTARISVNEKHEIFKGHFPGNPIMPGVCMMQIIKELAEQITKRSLMMQTLSNVKFMALINPNKTPELQLDLDIAETDGGTINLKNTTLFGETIALKLSSTYKTL